MVVLIKWLFKHKRVIQNRKFEFQNQNGFTLIELLVAMAISAIVITTILSFANNMISNERREQVKATTEQEIQAALDYISDDLQEAVYIYDADGVTAIKSQLPLPEDKDKVPILVFWKRSFLPKDSEITLINGTTTVGCLAKIPHTNICNERDYHIYSLVAYYLIKNSDSINPDWSNTAQIGRFEIQNGVRDPYSSHNYLPNKTPDPGFKIFDLTNSGNIKDKMNAWKKDELINYDLNRNPIDILIDYIDQSTGSEVPKLESCTITTSPNAQQVPANNPNANPLEIYSFYACVDSSKTLARVYLRGNAMARIDRNATYSNSQSAYFPAASVQVQSRGKIDAE